MSRLSLRGLDTTGADATNDTPRYNPSTDSLEYAPSGTVQSVVAGTGIAVDDTDPANPIVSTTGSTSGSGAKIAAIKYAGALAIGTGATRLYNDTGATWTITSVRASVETAPSGGTVQVDVNVNGTTIFTTQTNRPSIASGGLTSGKVTNMDVTAVADGAYLTVDVDTVTAPAANLTVLIGLK